MKANSSVMPRGKKKANLRASEEREEAIQAATKAVSEGQSIRNAAKAFGVPYSTLRDHCSGK